MVLYAGVNTQYLKSLVHFQIKLNNATYSFTERIKWLSKEIVHCSESTMRISHLKIGE
jgi:hypothetical protein